MVLCALIPLTGGGQDVVDWAGKVRMELKNPFASRRRRRKKKEEAARLVMPMKMRKMGGDREVEDGGGGERLVLAA